MTKRPLNECLNCGKTWYPRGQRLSDCCPRCRSTKVTNGWTSNSTGSNPTLLGCGCLIVVLLGLIGILSKGLTEKKQTSSEKAPDHIANASEKKPAEDKTSDAGDKEKPQAKPTQAISKVKDPSIPIALKPKLEIAPPPRRVDPSVPPPGFTSDWVRVGSVRTRVAGIKLAPVKLADRNGRESLSSDSYLAIWVETECLLGPIIELRRWINPGEAFANLMGSNDKSIPPVRFAAGFRPAGQLDRTVGLVPGGLGAIDVLVFEKPDNGIKSLTLELDGSHVNQVSPFFLKIPASAWK